MAEGFKIADAYVEVSAKLDRAAIEREATAAGEQAGDSFGRGADGRIRDSRGRIASGAGDTFRSTRRPAEDAGDDAGRGLLDNFGKAFSGGFLTTLTAGMKGSGFASAFASNPVVAGVGAAIAGGILAVALPAIGAGLAAGLVGASGIGTIVAGATLAASRSPEIKAAAGALGKAIMGVDTAPLQEAYDAAQAKYTAAVESGSEARIKAARREVAETKKALDDAGEFNDGNASLPDMARGSFTQPMLDSIAVLKTAWTDLAPSIKQAFDAVAPSLVPLTEGLAGFIKEAMPGFVDMLKNSGPLLTELAKHMPEIGKALGGFFEILSNKEVMDGAVKFLGDLLTFIEGTVLWTGMLIGALSAAYGAIHDFFAAIPGWLDSAGKWFKETGTKIKKFFSDLWADASALPGKIGGFFSEMATTVSTTVEGWYNGVTGWFGKIGDAISDKIKAGTDKVSGWIDSMVGWFQALPDRIMTWLEALPARLGAFALAVFDGFFYAIGLGGGSIVEFFVKLPDRIVGAVSFLGEKLSLWWTTTSTNVSAWVSKTVDDLVAWFTALPDRIITAVTSTGTKIQTWWTTTSTNVLNWVGTTIAGVEAWFRGLPDKASNAVSSLWSKISGWFTGTRDNASREAGNAVDGVINWFKQAPGRAWSALSGLAGTVGSAVAGAGRWLWSAGQDVIRGLIDGINSMASWAWGMVQRAAHNITKGFLDAFIIGSPSKLMADKVGRWLPPGIVEGVDKAMPSAQRELAGLAPEMVGAGPGSAPGPSAGSTAGRTALSIGNLNVRGVWDFTNPAAIRAMIATLYEALAAYEKEYA